MSGTNKIITSAEMPDTAPPAERQWRIKYMRRGSEPPYPFGREEEIIGAPTREIALRLFMADRGEYVSREYKVTASRIPPSV